MGFSCYFPSLVCTHLYCFSISIRFGASEASVSVDRVRELESSMAHLGVDGPPESGLGESRSKLDSGSRDQSLAHSHSPARSVPYLRLAEIARSINCMLSNRSSFQ